VLLFIILAGQLAADHDKRDGQGEAQSPGFDQDRNSATSVSFGGWLANQPNGWPAKIGGRMTTIRSLSNHFLLLFSSFNWRLTNLFLMSVSARQLLKEEKRRKW